jgi:LppP/LprE lipoprotein
MACALALGAVGGVPLGGCGGGTKTVTVSNAPAATAGARAGAHTSSTVSTPTTASTPAHTTSTATTTGTSSASEQPTSTTRTASAPAFVHTGGSASQTPSAEATAAAAVVSAHGYTAGDLSEYHPSQTLRVLVGTRTGSADGYNQLAFFFLGSHYLGTDSSQPSASMRVVSQSDTEVAIAYALYRSHDPLCCPSGGQTTVRFQLNNGQLVPLAPIPPASSSSGLARQ